MTTILSVVVIDPSGHEITLTNTGAGMYYLSASGVGVEETQIIAVRTPYQDGETAHGAYVPPRDVRLLFALATQSAAAQAQQIAELQSLLVCDPDATPYTLKLMRADRSWRALDGVFTHIRVDAQAPTYAEIVFAFHAPNPFWYNPERQQAGAYLGAGAGFSWPLSFPASFASTSIDDYVYVYNAGDVRTWPVIIVSGPCDDPIITNLTTGKAMEITQSQEAGDYIIIDMERATVKWYDASGGTMTNIIENVSEESEFWSLARGENKIHVQATGASGGSITIQWHNRYAGL